MATILVTGAAGFIGAKISECLLARGDHVVGVDNLNDYYEVELKRARLRLLQAHPQFVFQPFDIADNAALQHLMQQYHFTQVVHMAAQAGVRYSLTNPQVYIQSNLVGFGNILEACRHAAIEHLVFASSSSVYGANTRLPYREEDNVDHPISLYAASKKANELMAHSYAHLYGLPCTGLRFFTVYGPWGRPDMAPYKFTDRILRGQPIELYNQGDMQRDFTYIDDIVDGVLRVLDKPAAPNPDWGQTPEAASSQAPYRIYNIGNHRPEPLAELVAAIEAATGKQAQVVLKPMQAGDVYATYADVSRLQRDFGYAPQTSLRTGIAHLVNWYRQYTDPT